MIHLLTTAYITSAITISANMSTVKKIAFSSNPGENRVADGSIPLTKNSDE